MADVASSKERRILVAVDEGEESAYALSWCLKNVITDNSKDTLILLYAKPPRAVYTALDGTGEVEEDRLGYLFSTDITAAMDRYSSDVADCVIEKAKRMCKDLQDVKVETRIENGDPRDVICQMVEKLGADVLVMGSHGYGLLKRAFLGSVSNHCAQNVKCPVLIVKKPKTNAENK
ncbi:Universal stress protein [Trema orientale]|uniref:Universal stress protein n=1 Tax=Trema orientale TaxID=63057 RepID=A0A2P5EVB0_TREOI|nr:Universal stress protein [Trema orientale]